MKEIDDVAPGRGHGYVVDVTDPDAVSETGRKVLSEVRPGRRARAERAVS